jgi:hypothetical protein
VHRLDANTSGLIVFTRTRHFAKLVQPQFERGEVEKIYLARVHGHPTSEEFSCDAPIATEPTNTGARDIDGTSLLEARPLTGRTNQIRAQPPHRRRPRLFKQPRTRREPDPPPLRSPHVPSRAPPRHSPSAGQRSRALRVTIPDLGHLKGLEPLSQRRSGTERRSAVKRIWAPTCTDPSSEGSKPHSEPPVFETVSIGAKKTYHPVGIIPPHWEEIGIYVLD